VIESYPTPDSGQQLEKDRRHSLCLVRLPANESAPDAACTRARKITSPGQASHGPIAAVPGLPYRGGAMALPNHEDD
jgi:hypothetical protein